MHGDCVYLDLGGTSELLIAKGVGEVGSGLIHNGYCKPRQHELESVLSSADLDLFYSLHKLCHATSPDARQLIDL